MLVKVDYSSVDAADIAVRSGSVKRGPLSLVKVRSQYDFLATAGRH